ncbi:MAG: hypothetical protein V2A78_00925 [bacterium]
MEISGGDMPDESHLDQKYFIDPKIYNCPYCNRRHVAYTSSGAYQFDWTNEKKCTAWFVQCNSCKKISMHLTYEELQNPGHLVQAFKNTDLDAAFFYSVPTSFFIIDTRIPRVVRELIAEADGCIKMNYLTGASACCRKAIYELTVIEKAEGEDYEARIKFLKAKFSFVDTELFDVLCHIKDMTSDKIHEQSWDKWDAKHLTLFLETLKAILHEIYVVPDERKTRSTSVKSLLQGLREKQSKKNAGEQTA